MKRFGSAAWNGGLRDPKPGAELERLQYLSSVAGDFSDLTVSQNEVCSSE